MTKSAKHKKEFRKEKNKIKLKLTARAARPRVGKAKKTGKTQFLPKGLNVTDTSFKTKKIVLPENLKPDENSGVPLTSRKQTFKVKPLMCNLFCFYRDNILSTCVPIRN